MQQHVLQMKVLTDQAYPIQMGYVGHPLTAMQSLLDMWMDAANNGGFLYLGGEQFWGRNIRAVLFERVQ